jgi:3',5'-cyclic AMP phosphodiesterase CpdA
VTAWYTKKVRRAVLALGLVLVLAAAGGAAQPRAVRIIAIGDFGVGGETQLRFGAAVRSFEARNPADILVTVGDNDYTENPSAFRANWEATFGWTSRAGVKIAGVLGNHDVRIDGGRYEFDELRMPKRYYRRAIGPVELYLLDSNSVDAEQTAWLRRTLARSRARWRIAVAHHPAFTCGKYSSHPQVVARWVPLFERYRVRLFLAGHDHNYQRFAPRRGVRYVIHGGGNSTNLYGLATCPSGFPRRAAARTEHGFLYLVIRGNRLDGWAVTVTGRRTDHFAFRG